MQRITPPQLNKKLAFSAVFGRRKGRVNYETRPDLGAGMFIHKRLWWGGADSGGATTLPTTPTTPTPPPAATGRPALAASGYASAGAQVRFGETYELANDQSLRGTPTSRGI